MQWRRQARRSRKPRPGRKTMAIGVGVALVAIVAVGFGLTRLIDRHSEETRPVNFGGVRIVVPASWDRNATQCGEPVRNTYIVDQGELPNCALIPVPRVDYAQFRLSDDLSSDPDAKHATSAAQVDGHPVRRGADVLPDGRCRRTVVVPDRGVILIVVSAHLSTCTAISESVAIS